MVQQGSDLSDQPHIVIATPGRLAALIDSGSSNFTLKKIKFLVLDEADRLLEKSFEEDLEVSMDMLYNECGFLKVFSCKGIIKLFLAFIITALYMKMFEKLLVC